MSIQDLVATRGFLTNGLFPRPLEFLSSVLPFRLLGESFEPERDIRDLSGQVVFITGGMIYVYPPKTRTARYKD